MCRAICMGHCRTAIVLVQRLMLKKEPWRPDSQFVSLIATKKFTGVRGLEPLKAEPESAVIPLHHTPKINDLAQLVVYRNLANQSISLKINQFCRQFAGNACKKSVWFVVKQDYDFYLMSLFWKRFVWRDDRYCFKAKHYTNKGGLYTHRSCSKEAECIKILQHKYGKRVVGTVKNKPWKIKLMVALPEKA